MRRFIQQCNLKCIAKTPKQFQNASFHQIVKNNRFSNAYNNPILTTFRYKNSSANPSLSDLLTNEIANEKENDEVDEELEKIKKIISKPFKISDQQGLGVVKLTRKYKDELIEVSFDCQNTREDDTDLDEIDDEEKVIDQDNEDEEDSGVYGIQFEVTINKGHSKILIDCVAGEALEIENIRYVGGEHSSKDLIEVYGGPIFTDLDESVQAAFFEYLNERSINDELSYFVLAYSRDKEQKEYVNWLQNIHDFTSANKK